MRIRADDMKKFGYTGGCPGCVWHTERIGPHRGHSSECRKRIEEAMAETEEGRKRMEVTKARKDKHEEQKKSSSPQEDKGENEEKRERRRIIRRRI